MLTTPRGTEAPRSNVALTYQTGEEIRRGDRVIYDGNPGVIELVVETSNDNDWLFETCGPGIMLAEPKLFGRVYLRDPHQDEDLQFVGRADSA
jgi:hypothetical protein